MHANTLALGRDWATCDSLSITCFGDCWRIDIRWNDGAHAYMLHDTHADANRHAASLGWRA